MSNKNTKNAFSLVELLISLIVISCITAAFTPLITKKFSNNIYGGGGSVSDITADCEKFGPNCNLCTSNFCLACEGIACTNDQYKDNKSCTCKKCVDKYGEFCASCISDKCLTCVDGYYLNENNVCTSCLDKFSNCVNCDINQCKTCDTGYLLKDGKCEIDCAYRYGNFCIVCDSSKCNTCATGYKLKDGKCEIDCAYKYDSNCTNCNVSDCSACAAGYKLSGGKCITDCTYRYGNTCNTCNDTKCTGCITNYKLSSNPSANPACEKEFCIGENFMKLGNLCVTRKNMGDSAVLRIPSGVNVVSAGSACNSSGSTKCCWNGTTANYSECNNENGGGYSGCYRTVCNWASASYICGNFHAGGYTWRLPTASEMSNWYNYSKGLGTSGLQLCNQNSGYSSAHCHYSSGGCIGARGDDCFAKDVWANGRYYFALDYNNWILNSTTEDYAFSVRCVTDL